MQPDSHTADAPERHIMLVYQTHFPEIQGGIDTLISCLTEALGAHARVSLFVPGDWEDARPRVERHGRVTLHRLRLRLPVDPDRPLRGLLAGLWEFPRTLWRLWRLLRAEKVTALHLFTLQTHQIYFRLLRLLGGPPYLLTFVGSDALLFNEHPRGRARLLRWILAGADRVSAVSPALEEVVRTRFPEARQVDCVVNGLPLAEFSAAALAQESAFLPHPYFVVVGCLSPGKGQENVIRAWRLIAKRRPGVHLALIGAGNPGPGHPERLQALILAEGLAETVHLIETMPRKTMLAVTRNSLGVISTTRAEGLPFVLLEAGAMALPVIFSDIRPLSDVIQHGKSGLLVPLDDPETLARTVGNLLEDPQWGRRMGENLRRTIEASFSAEKMASDYLRLYDEMRGLS